ncbi:MAG: preprotein translocase subunit SecE [Firmicutes bacterium]|nr:preprotein translocase subunit SecE [Bacillota bacterium]
MIVQMKFNVKGTANRVVRYLRETRSELKKVLWPSRKETIVFTSVVVLMVVVVSGVMWVMDAVFSTILGLIIK